MSTKSREVIFGSQIRGAKIRGEGARERAMQAVREADRAEAESLVDPHGGPRRAGAAITHDRRSVLNGGYGWLEVECNRFKTRASLPLDAIHRPRDTPIWKLEAALKCRCRKGRYAPPVHMIKLTETPETTPYLWVRPDEERWLAYLGCCCSVFGLAASSAAWPSMHHIPACRAAAVYLPEGHRSRAG